MKNDRSEQGLAILGEQTAKLVRILGEVKGGTMPMAVYAQGVNAILATLKEFFPESHKVVGICQKSAADLARHEHGKN